MSEKKSKKKRDFTQYVHEYKTALGQTRYAVGEWDQKRGQFTRRFDKTEARTTGCSAEFARKPSGMQNFKSRKRALRRARYLFYEMDRDYHNFLADIENW